MIKRQPPIITFRNIFRIEVNNFKKEINVKKIKELKKKK